MHTLWSWSARMQDEKRAPGKSSKPGTEVRMALVRPAPSARSIEVTATPVAPVETGVHLRVGAVHVEVERGFDGQTLKRVLQVLEERGDAG